MNNISFTGTYVRSAKVYKNSEAIRAAIIELDKRDVRSVQRVTDKWDSHLTDLMCAKFYQPDKYKNARFFAISTQDADYQKVNPSKVLGLFEVDDNKTVYTLQYLDVHPRYRRDPNSSAKRKGITKIGEACIDFVRNRFATKKETELYALEEAKPFYDKVGCKKAPNASENRYVIV